MKKEYIVILPIIILTILIILFLTENISVIDNVYNYIVIHNDKATIFFKGITFFGSTLGIIMASICLLIFYKDKKDLIGLYVCILLSTIINFVLKWMIARPRPALIHLVTETSTSFPSGHAMSSLTFYGYIIYLLWKSEIKQIWKKLGTCFLSLFILTIGYSRIYLNVHYVSDVLAGFCVSCIYLLL